MARIWIVFPALILNEFGTRRNSNCLREDLLLFCTAVILSWEEAMGVCESRGCCLENIKRYIRSNLLRASICLHSVKNY